MSEQQRGDSDNIPPHPAPPFPGCSPVPAPRQVLSSTVCVCMCVLMIVCTYCVSLSIYRLLCAFVDESTNTIHLRYTRVWNCLESTQETSCSSNIVPQKRFLMNLLSSMTLGSWTDFVCLSMSDPVRPPPLSSAQSLLQAAGQGSVQFPCRRGG